jgi:predicted membrane channel-forming protein YqfA (hemolysin III family)
LYINIVFLIFPIHSKGDPAMLLNLKLRIGAFLMIIGALLAVAGEIVNIHDSTPLDSSWFIAIGLIVIGALVLIYGANMYAQLSSDLNLLGVLGSGLLFLGGLATILGAVVIDGVVLPLLFALATAIAASINSLGSGVQNAANTVSSGLSGIGNTISSAFGGSSSAANIPQAQIPQVDGLKIVNSALTGMKLPTIDVIGNWGHFFLTGGPLAIGGLILGLALLRTKTFPRTTAILILATAALDLICQLLMFLPVLAGLASILFFLSLGWLGVSVIFPEKANFSFNLSSVSALPRSILRSFQTSTKSADS